MASRSEDVVLAKSRTQDGLLASTISLVIPSRFLSLAMEDAVDWGRGVKLSQTLKSVRPYTVVSIGIFIFMVA